MISRTDIEDMTDAQDEAPERIWAASNRTGAWAGCGGWSVERNDWDAPMGFPDAEYVRADLARAAIDRLSETCGYAISQWEGWVRSEVEGTSSFAPAMAEIEQTRAAVRDGRAFPDAQAAELAALIHDMDRLKARETDLTNENETQAARIAKLEASLSSMILAGGEPSLIDGSHDERMAALNALLAAMKSANAALAAMDTPKGGGDE